MTEMVINCENYVLPIRFHETPLPPRMPDRACLLCIGSNSEQAGCLEGARILCRPI